MVVNIGGAKGKIFCLQLTVASRHKKKNLSLSGHLFSIVSALKQCLRFFGWYRGTVYRPVKTQKHVNNVLSFKKYFSTVFSVINF